MTYMGNAQGSKKIIPAITLGLNGEAEDLMKEGCWAPKFYN